MVSAARRNQKFMYNLFSPRWTPNLSSFKIGTILPKNMALILLTLIYLSLLPVLGRELTLGSNVDILYTDFVQRFWTGSNWKHASSWTGDSASRLVINYLDFLDCVEDHHIVDNMFLKVLSRSLSKWTLLQYLTQGYDDFGWTTFLLLEIMRYSHQHEKMYPTSQVTQRLPILNKRLAFRAAFLHDAMKDSWSKDICNGGAEWKVRTWKVPLWPSLDLEKVYKNSITNHLYNANNAQIYNASLSRPRPYDLTEVSVELLRLTWKLLRPLFGWSRDGVQLADFNDLNFIHRALDGLQWMKQSHLISNDSLYMDGTRPRFVQASTEEHPMILCDATVKTLFTYNQVAGTRALRYLSRATEDVSILSEGHDTIRNLIAASYNGRLGRDGILQDRCDRFGNCTQDMQIFKGLPFLDIKNFCELIDWTNTQVQVSHRENCSSYRLWIGKNAAAAQATLDRDGNFGVYWGLDPRRGAGQIRSIETQVAGLSVMLVSSWFDKNFT